ncbi:MAG: hypothetical protein E7587_04360 [Ruminococcaceae bacterium]|nr:hypothetical protein [Oscillospiraceae bacterium]
MKKRIILFAVIMLMLLAVASCGSNKNPAVTTEEPAITTQPLITLGTTEGSVTTEPVTSEPIITTGEIFVTTTVSLETTAPVITTNPFVSVDTPEMTLPVSNLVLTPPEVTAFTYYAQKPVWVQEEVVVKERLTKDDIYRGSLLLVNNDYPVRNEEDLAENYLKEVYGLRAKKDGNSVYWLVDNQIKANEDVIDALNEMFSAYYTEAGDDFKRLTIYSAYRSSAAQQALYDKQYKIYGEDTSKYIPKAGCSDYQAGLSVFFKHSSDGLTYEMNSKEAKPALDWLKANAYKYGFVFRYPTDKADITGIEDEMSQYQLRYVGKAHSYFMNEFNLCLEEYIPFLKTFKYGENHLLIYFIGTQFESFYVEAEEDITEIRLAFDAVYEVSGNNADGFFVTIYRDLTVEE